MTSAVSESHVRITSFAWGMALDVAATSSATQKPRYLSSDPRRFIVSAEPAQRKAAWEELQAAGLLDHDGTLAKPWARAASMYLDPPILIRAGVQWRQRSSLSEISIYGGRGLCVSHLSQEAGGTSYPSREVNLSLFPEEQFWDTLAGDLPPVQALRAPAAQALRTLFPMTGCTADAQKREARHDPTLVRPEVAGDVARIVSGSEASLTASMLARSGGRSSVWAGAWTATGESLHSIHSDASRNTMSVTPVPLGSIHLELTYALAGAHEFLAPSSIRTAS